MKTAKHEFAILPWEYRGANFDPAPHAITSLNFNGQKREFLLKMRDGIIYFKEPKRHHIFAVPYRFERDICGEELIKVWKAQVEQENYGRFVKTNHHLSGGHGDTIAVSIHRADYSGWVSDAFNLDWKETPKHREGKKLDLWNDTLDQAKSRAIRRASLSLFDRIMPPEERRTLHSRWVVGNQAELHRIFSIIVRLYTRNLGYHTLYEWFFEASSIASPGGFMGGFLRTPDRNLQFATPVAALVKLLEQQFVWVGIKWKYRKDKIYQPAPYLPDPLTPMSEKWGQHWRGRYEMVCPALSIKVEIPASPSQHERLELSLELREWLKDKVSPRQMERWLSQIPD